MKWDCFLQLEKCLKKDGAKNIIVFIESNKEHSTINGIACDREEINITYKAFKERLKKLLQFYKSS